MSVPPVVIARRRIVRQFFAADAVRAGDAIEFTPHLFILERVFERMLAANIVRKTADGKYWLDLPAYGEWRGSLRKRAMMAAGIALGAGVALFALVG